MSHSSLEACKWPQFQRNWLREAPHRSATLPGNTEVYGRRLGLPRGHYSEGNASWKLPSSPVYASPTAITLSAFERSGR